MTTPALVWGSPEWIAGALALWGVSALLLLWSYSRSGASRPVRAACALLKGFGFAALVVALVEPLLSGTRPRRGANAFVVLADNSQSLLIRDESSATTRADWARDRLKKDAPWKTRLSQDFDVRGYAFDTHLRAVDGFEALKFDGTGSSLSSSLSALSRRFRGLPLAGVLIFTDGNRTDVGDVDASTSPPLYPVVPPSRGATRDVGVTNLAVSQTNFESAPVVLQAQVGAVGFKGETVVATLTDEAGKVLDRQEAKSTGDGAPLAYRFQFRPERKGVSVFRVRAVAVSDEKTPDADPSRAGEQTLANNSRLVVVDQGSGPYRVLYVGGRPNWEFKFLRRALADDDQVQLVGLLRVARRQPKFDFRKPGEKPEVPLFTGFDDPDAETADTRNQPVLIRFGTDEVELRDGFPKTADELYKYSAVIIDDLEAGFFTQDQLALVRNFVSQRGGGLLMLGGPDSFADGKYDRTPVGDVLPVYLNASRLRDDPTAAGEHRLVLTREGWLQPWVRTRKTEDEERNRLAATPPFLTVNRVGEAKPGAVVLSQVSDAEGKTAPALVAQQFGKGRVGALMVGDVWRWGLKRANVAEDDLDRSWRQTVRWLVGDVPGRVEVSTRPKADATSPAVELSVRVRDAEYRPLDNAKVSLELTLPGGDRLTLDAEPDGREPGAYTAAYVPKQPGAFRVVAKATAPDGSAVGEREAGWAAQPAADEFARLEPDREYLKSLAAKTGGEVVSGDGLDAFVRSLATRAAPVTEPWTSPLWHHPVYFLVALICLTAEWGLRRINGLA